MTVQQQRHACPTGKVRYHNRVQCRAAIDTTRNRAAIQSFGQLVLPRMWPNRCRECNGWHMTKRPPHTWPTRTEVTDA